MVNEFNQPHNNNSSFGKAFETHTMQHSLSKANCFHIIVAQVSSKKCHVDHFYCNYKCFNMITQKDFDVFEKAIIWKVAWWTIIKGTMNFNGNAFDKFSMVFCMLLS